MKLSIIIPTLDGAYRFVLPDKNDLGINTELIIVKGITPVSAARNEGLTRATGDYIAWVDSDDDVEENWLDEIAKALEHRPDVLSFNVRAKWLDVSRSEYLVGGEANAADVMAERANGQLWNKVIRRELFQGLYFEGVVHEDYRLLCELLPRARTFRHIDEELYVYRRSVKGLSQHLDVDSARNAILGLIKFCYDAPAEWRRDIKKGVAQRAADFCRNAESSPELRSFIRSALPSIMSDWMLPVRAKIKCLLAGVGL